MNVYLQEVVVKVACRSVGELILPCREETSRCLSHIYGRQTEDFGDYHGSAELADDRVTFLRDKLSY